MEKAEGRLHMLQRNNQQLSAELSIVRQENSKLEKELEDLRKKEEEYADTVAAVDRAWQQLLDDINYMARRFKGFNSEVKSEAKLEVPKLENSDPLLQRLISTSSVSTDALAKRLEDIADDATDVEKALVPRSAATQQVFADLIDVQERILSNGAATESSDSGPQNNPHGNGFRQTPDHTANLRKEVDAQRAISRTSQAQLRQLTDMLQKDEKTIQELKNELADRKEELNAANRKLHTLREDGLAPQHSLPLPVKRQRSSSSPPPAAELQSHESLQITERELKTERDRADSLGRQVRDLQAKIQDESFVSSTVLYQNLQRQSQVGAAELDKLRKLTDTLQRDNDAFKHHMHYMSHQIEDTKHLRRVITMMEERVQEAEQQVLKARQSQDAKALEVQQWLSKAGNPETSSQLRGMVATLEQEAETNRLKLKNRQSLLDALEKANVETRQALLLQEEQKDQIGKLQERLEVESAQLRETSNREKELKVVADDLRLFVEVLQTFCADPRDLTEVRVSEARLKDELQTVQRKLKGHELQAELEQVTAGRDMAEESLNEMVREKKVLERTNADVSRECADLRQQSTLLAAEIEAYTGEMEVIGTAYEEMQSKNSALLQQMIARDDRINTLMTEQAQAQHRAQALVEEAQRAGSAKQAIQQQATAHQERLTVLEGRNQELMTDLGQTKERVTSLTVQTETLGNELRERDLVLTQKEALLLALTATAEQRKQALEEEAGRSQKERSKRQRIEEECKVLHNKVGKLSSGQAVSEELEAMRLMTHCQVCHVRRKDTVIVKCWHTFCGECIKRNLESRNRKCPACSHTFGAGDVKQIYL